MDQLLTTEFNQWRQHRQVHDIVGLSGILCQSTAVRRRRLRQLDDAMLAALQRVRSTARKHIQCHWSDSVHYQQTLLFRQYVTPTCYTSTLGRRIPLYRISYT